jgi:hypothetical protein
MATVDELTTPLTKDEVQAAIYAAIEARGTSTTSWKPGAIARTIIAGVAIVGSAFSRLQADIAKSGFLDLASGPWLTIVAKYIYGVDRDVGSFATGEVVLDNDSGGVHVVGVGDLVVLNSATGKNYRNTEAFTLSGFEMGEVVPVQAVELGTESNAAPGEIDDFVTPLVDVDVTNPTALVGTDEEKDEALRVRCRAKTGLLSPNGPRDAYAYIALSAKNAAGESIGVNRIRTVPDGLGGIDVYVATPTGGVTGDPEDPNTNLGAIADAIHRWAEPLAITPLVQSAAPLVIPFEYTLWISDKTGFTNAEIQALVAARLLAYVGARPIGGDVLTPGTPGKVWWSALLAVIGDVIDDEGVRVSLDLPVNDVDVDLNEAPVVGTITPTIIQVAGDVI